MISDERKPLVIKINAPLGLDRDGVVRAIQEALKKWKDDRE